MIIACFLFLLGFLISLLTTPWVIRLAQRSSIGIDEANESRKRHNGAIPRLGGMPIILALSVGLVGILTAQFKSTGDWLAIMMGALSMCALGLWDDFKPLGARKKLVAQVAIAALVYALGLRIEFITYPGGAWSVELGWLGLPLTMFWLIAVPNIINLIDGFDGLAGGLGMFMAVTLGVVGLMAEQLPVAWFAFTLAGSLLGFLVFNFPPARIFLGDGGAYLIGFCIAALSLTSSQKGSIGAVLLVTIVALGVPILDTSFALMRRALRGFPLFEGDAEHVHHRLEDLGFSKRRIVLAMYGVCVVLSLIGLSIFWSQGRTIPIAIGAVFLLAVFAARYLQYVHSFSEVSGQVGRLFSRRRTVRYALLQAQILDLEVERCTDSEEFWRVFEQSLRRVGFLEAGDWTDEEALQIDVKYNGSKPWTLHAPREVGTLAEWQRIAECFRPIYVKGVAKWRR
ncbi:MAG: UDP-GlcNAc:undecaprenyl-phosphate/decaprenyl-phosphate GlcNAc-phosphate transferase [Chthoniobacter sp.]|jgi:UDP-GlcNAc:undecaprenyl-phosphate GlcNAc-1-phosphate transferase|nr:UDP-GlcNAc:undecaprenyl-phosphate/decaprenyl-phosphate GlcNAc-phosphate transferase [Chthoniobacter sp.]